jgi:release factor glutamine methyltransferase
VGSDEGFEDVVYQPAEDSELLAEAAHGEIEASQRALDVGTGSGYVAARVAETGACVIGSDLNPHACRQAREHGLEVVRTDLVSGFGTEEFDVVLFNPPYLPTDPESASDDWMERALSGGESGRAVVEPFVGAVSRVLRPEGFVLVLVSSLTGLEEVESLAREAGFAVEEVSTESHFFEQLVVLKLSVSEE